MLAVRHNGHMPTRERANDALFAFYFVIKSNIKSSVFNNDGTIYRSESERGCWIVQPCKAIFNPLSCTDGTNMIF
jgi:hypothetical protein